MQGGCPHLFVNTGAFYAWNGARLLIEPTLFIVGSGLSRDLDNLWQLIGDRSGLDKDLLVLMVDAGSLVHKLELRISSLRLSSVGR
jgi:hypothetical protein